MQPIIDLSADADGIRRDERDAIVRLASAVAAESARASGRKEDATVAVDYIDFILKQAFAARDAELERLRKG